MKQQCENCIHFEDKSDYCKFCLNKNNFKPKQLDCRIKRKDY